MFDHHKGKAFSLASIFSMCQGADRVKTTCQCNGTAQFVLLRSGWTESHQFEICRIKAISGFHHPAATTI